MYKKGIKYFLLTIIALITICIVIIHVGSYYMSQIAAKKIDRLDGELRTYSYSNTDIRTLAIDNDADTLLVFVHGAPGTMDAFINFLSDDSFNKYNLLTYDRPGYGASSPSPISSIIEQSNFLLNIINEHPSEHIVVIGHSYGSAIAAYAMIQNSDLIDKMIMIAPLIDPDHEPIFWYSYFGKWQLTKWVLTNDLQTSGTEKFTHASALEEIAADWMKIENPIMHIHGTDDALAPPSHNIEFSKRNIREENLDLKIYPNKGHLILWKDYNKVKLDILEFIEKDSL